MNWLHLFVVFWFGGSVASASSITLVSKLGGKFKTWAMIAGSLFWPVTLYFAWRDHRKMSAEITGQLKAGLDELYEDVPHHVHVDPEELCPACRASFEAVMNRIFGCRLCTPLPRNTETEH